MEINNVKDLKGYLATLPAEADEWEINFIDSDENGGITTIGNVATGQWPDDADEVTLVESDTRRAGVDSGQMMISDYNYYVRNQSSERWYNRVCDITCSDKEFGILDRKAVVSSSGFGDGMYDVISYSDPEGRIVSIKVVFIDDEDNI